MVVRNIVRVKGKEERVCGGEWRGIEGESGR